MRAEGGGEEEEEEESVYNVEGETKIRFLSTCWLSLNSLPRKPRISSFLLYTRYTFSSILSASFIVQQLHQNSVDFAKFRENLFWPTFLFFCLVHSLKRVCSTYKGLPQVYLLFLRYTYFRYEDLCILEIQRAMWNINRFQMLKVIYPLHLFLFSLK